MYDAETRELTRSYDEVTVWQPEFGPNGDQLAVSAQVGPNETELPRPSVRLVDPVTLEDEPVQLGGIPERADPGHPHYSADGRFMVVSFGLEGGDAVVVWDLESPQRPVRRVDVPGAGEGAGLSPDGSVLYVGRRDPAAVTVFDVATGRSLNSTPVPADWLEVSPDGSLVAAVAGHDIILLDAATLTERGRLRGHSEQVTAMRFSHSGALLASGSDDRNVIVWDVAGAQPQEELRGHVGAVWGVDFSPDDKTLYSAGLDGALLIWDLVGDRRFIPRHPILEPVSFSAGGAFGSPSGEAVAYVANLAGDDAALQFLDLNAGQVGPRIDTGHRAVRRLGLASGWAPLRDGREGRCHSSLGLALSRVAR